MDLNLILIWTVLASSVLSSIQIFDQRNSRARLILPGIVLLILLGAWLSLPDQSGIISGAAWLLLMVLPGLGLTWLSRLMGRRKYRRARLLASVLRWLHPFDGMWILPRLITAMDHLQRGPEEQALAELQRLQHQPGGIGRAARVLLTRVQGNWSEFIEWIHSTPDLSHTLSDGLLLDAYLQALGETGQIENMLAVCSHSVRPGRTAPGTLTAIRMKVSAFCGDPDWTLRAVSLAGDDIPVETGRYWMATALQAAGDLEMATHTLLELAAHPQAGIARPAERRLRHPVRQINPALLSPISQQILHHLKLSAGLEQNALWGLRSRRTPGTWLMAGILTVVFACELPGGAENYANLVRMGAMLIPMELNGDEWWRAIAAAFLHYGWLHFSLNTLGLIALGHQLERLWGTGAFLITYLLAATGSIALAPLFMHVTLDDPTILVGASGGVMGLIGGLLAQVGLRLWTGRTPAMLRQFAVIVCVVALQMIFDYNTPNVSSEAHLLGLGIGIGCGLLANGLWSWQARRARRNVSR